MSASAGILLCIELLLALAVAWREGLLKKSAGTLIAVLLIIGAFALRWCCFDYETLDWQDWISRWIGYFREGGAWKTLGTELWACNYNVPYLYALAIISTLGIRDLYLVKALSVLFDIFLAWGCEKLVSLFTEKPLRRLIAFIAVLYLPTVYLNGAYWGQCDSIYAAFAVWSLYLILSDRPVLGMISIAVSFSIKLQAIFIMPVYLVFLFAKKIRIPHLFIFPAAYIATILPAVIAGRSFWDLLLLYYNNTGSIGEGLNYNSSSVYSVTSFAPLCESAAGALGIILAFSLCAALFVWAWLRRDKLNNRVLFLMALVLCIGVPWLLPHMHDRYFFMADVLSLTAAVLCPAMIPAAVFVSVGSLLGYNAYLNGYYALIVSYRHPMMLGGLCMGAALIIAIYALAKSFKNLQISS